MVTKKTDAAVDPWAEDGDQNIWGGSTAPAKSERDFLTITLKGGNQDTWLVAHANSVEEGVEFIDHPQLSELMEKVAAREAEYQRVVRAAKGAAPLPTPSTKTGWGTKTTPRAGSSTQGQVKDGMCEHGEAVQKSGRSVKGEWTANMCPAGQGNCKPEWL